MKAPDYKQSRRIFYTGLAGGFALAVLFGSLLKIYWIGYICIAAVMLSLFQTFLFYVCPHCKKNLNIRSGSISYCPHCGEKLE